MRWIDDKGVVGIVAFTLIRMDKFQTWFWEEYSGPFMNMAEAFAKVHP